jgi:hypothetical protein
LSPGAEPDGSASNTNTNNSYDFGLLPDCNCINTSGNLLTNGSFESGTTGWTAVVVLLVQEQDLLPVAARMALIMPAISCQWFTRM